MEISHSVGRPVFTHGLKGTIHGKGYYFRIFILDNRCNALHFNYYSEYLIEV